MNLNDFALFDQLQLEGRWVLVVNIAAECDYTYQLEDLERLYQQFPRDRFEIAAFATNIFRQNPGSIEDTRSFCEKEYNTTFPIIDKIDEDNPVWQALEKLPPPATRSWNYQKWLFDTRGRYLRRYSSDIPVEEIHQILTRFIV
jgi:glutathione peroxidase